MKGHFSLSASTGADFRARASNGATRSGRGRTAGRRLGVIAMGLGLLVAAGCGTGAKAIPDPSPPAVPLAASVPASPAEEFPHTTGGPGRRAVVTGKYRQALGVAGLGAFR